MSLFVLDFFVIKLRGTDGRELWRQTIASPGADVANSVAVGAAGDVFAVGLFDGKFIVAKFDGGSGDERWRRLITGSLNNVSSAALAVSVDASGNVFAG